MAWVLELSQFERSTWGKNSVNLFDNNLKILSISCVFLVLCYLDMNLYIFVGPLLLLFLNNAHPKELDENNAFLLCEEKVSSMNRLHHK